MAKSAKSNEKDEKSVFEEETRHRTFKILVAGKTFFVNPSFLAERSFYFETLLFGDFKEKKEGKAELREVKAKDFEEFLLVLGADPMRKKKKVDAVNFPGLANFCHLWDVPQLREELIDFIDNEYEYCGMQTEIALDVSIACELIKPPVSTMKIVVSKLAQFPTTALVRCRTHEKLSPLISAAVFLASEKPYDSSEKRCSHTGCNKNKKISSVEMSHVDFCPSHAKLAEEWTERDHQTRNLTLGLFRGKDVLLNDLFFTARL